MAPARAPDALGSADVARRAAEPVLEAPPSAGSSCARCQAEGGATRLQYRVRLKKSVTAESLVQSLRTGAAPHVSGVELADGAR